MWPNLPWDYIPTWILITTPPIAVILAAVGIGCVARLCAADWRAALANSTARFGLLALACLILPVAAIVALDANTFNGWRHMYFLYAPMCVLAAFGLRWLAALPKPRLRAGAFAPVALGIAVVAVQMVRLHPHQHEYFSPLTDKSELADRWEMNYWFVSYKDALDALLETQPSGRVLASALHGDQWKMDRDMWLVPPDDRRRLAVAQAFPSFLVFAGAVGDFEYPVIWKREVYGVTVAAILDVRAETEAAFQDAFAAALAPEQAASAGGFDIYADGGRLVYLNENCGEEVARNRFALSVFPVDPSDLPQTARDAGLEYETLDFDFQRYGARLDGKCAIVRDLPDYAISRVETARLAPGESRLWSVQIPIGERRERYERALSTLSGDPAASAGGFDIYADGGGLVYINEDCGAEDARGRFALFAFPVDQSVLSARARDAGLEYEKLDFDFRRYGARLDGKCVIVRRLPDYAISHVETGQWIPGESRLWSARIPLGGYRERYERALSSLSGEPAARSGFDIWLNGGTLTYVKENCDEGDARGRFFLSVFPVDPSDLPQTERDAGREHQALNFEFDRYGAILDGKCVIIRYLPAYPIGAIETGQWLPGEGELWKARIEEERRESSE